MMCNADYRKMKEQTEQVAALFPGLTVKDLGQKHVMVFYVPTTNIWMHPEKVEVFYDYECGLWDIQNGSGTWSLLNNSSHSEKDEHGLAAPVEEIAKWMTRSINWKYGEFNVEDIYFS